VIKKGIRKKKKKKGGKKGDKDGKKKKGKSEEEDTDAMPKLQGKTDLTSGMLKNVQEYESTWDGRDETDNFQQKHDVDIAKTVVRPGVYEDIRQQVDDMLLMNLKKIKMQIAPGGKGKKGKKGKKKGKKSKKNKGKKKKPLPGEKISELKGLDADHMLSVLIENQIVVRCRDKPMSSLIGDFNYLGSVHHNADRKDEGTWEPQDPSMSQLRQNITEYCILPNGSPDIKKATKTLIKSVMLYGPCGSGKTHAVEAVAHELGALLIHLSPSKLKGLFSGKQGPTKLVHMVMTVARDPTMQPVVIYIDECEQFFTGGKKNKDKEGPSRFKKDLLLYKNQALDNEHRVVIIGTTNAPENGDVKDMKSFFDKFLYTPYPDYSSRVQIWKYYVSTKIFENLKKQPQENDAKNGKQTNTISNSNTVSSSSIVKQKPKQVLLDEDELKLKVRLTLEKIDISSLAQVSEGYSAGAIARTCRIVLTTRRVAMLRLRPLSNLDFIDNLSFQDVTYLDDKITFMEFTKVITGLQDRRKKIENIVAGDVGDKKGDKKKNAGKGKKK